jgi:hypothetical protein
MAKELGQLESDDNFPVNLMRCPSCKHGELFFTLGACTEGKPKHGATRNPFTRAYTRFEVEKLLERFSGLKIFKTSACWSEIPFFGRRIRPYLCRLEGLRYYEEEMILRSGKPTIQGTLNLNSGGENVSVGCG